MPLSFLNVTIGSSQETRQANQRAGNITQLLFVGTKQYRVTLAQLAVGGDSGLVVQKFTGGVWSSIVDDATRTPANFCAAVVGTVIYICGFDDGGLFVTLSMFRFDTATDSFLSTITTTGIGQSGSELTMNAMPDGSLIVTGPTAARTLSAVRFDPSGPSFGPVVTIVPTPLIGGFVPMASCVDSGSGLCFVFYTDEGNQEIHCIPVDSTPTPYTDALVYAPTLNGNTLDHMMQLAIGTPCISGGRVCLPYLDPILFSSYADEVNVARATVGTAPVFSSEMVQSISAINAAYLPQTQNGSILFRDLLAIDQAGTLYVFYVVDNGDLENSSSLAFLYYNSSTGPGTWSGPNLVYTGPLGSEAWSPFANLDNGGLIALSLSWMNQHDSDFGDQAAGLLTKYFYQGSTPVRFGNEFR